MVSFPNGFRIHQQVLSFGLGKLVGLPTVNLQMAPQCVLPPLGVYATKTIVNGQQFYGITNVGARPTIDSGGELTIETHIFNFGQDIYGEQVELLFF